MIARQGSHVHIHFPVRSTEHRTIYRVHQRVAKAYRKGHVLLAGDAAHLNNPLGGLGMNSGIHDIWNLTKKLIRIFNGDGDDRLLDLYERHLLAGSRQERSGDGKSLRFLDKCENHFLLATAYAALAELVAPLRATRAAALPARPVFRGLGFTGARSRARRARGVEG